MRCELLTLGTRDPRELADELRALVAPGGEVSQAVAEIIARVRSGGDEAVCAYTRAFDTAGREPGPLRVTASELSAATQALDDRVCAGLELAIANVGRVAQAQARAGAQLQAQAQAQARAGAQLQAQAQARAGAQTGAQAQAQTEAQAQYPQPPPVDFGGHIVTAREAPIARAAVYVPGGKAPYPSTVVMGVLAARAAGVNHIAVCSPPGPHGELHPAVLAAAGLARASAVYRMGGAQAIAALAYGTESVAAVDVIVGPGNAYVQEAKRQVFGRVGIDGYAGPSELLVLAGADADPELLALDLLAQAEHGPGTLVVAGSHDQRLLARLQAHLVQGPETGATARAIATPNPEAGVALAEALAPEHLELVGREIEPLADRVTRAGCVFVGAAAGTAFGDYVAGSNHILPTGGSARFASALSPAHFTRRFYEVRITDPVGLAEKAAAVARVEGFELHAESMEARVRR